MPRISDDAFDSLYLLLKVRTGQDFSQYRKSTVYQRVKRRMVIHQLDQISDYVSFLQSNQQEVDLLFKELLIGVTTFFRDPAAWECLQESVLPQLLANYPSGANLRAWVAGCSSGEEAFTLAMVFQETLARLKPTAAYSLQIFATDLDSDAIQKARRGKYASHIAEQVSEDRLNRFFTVDREGYLVRKDIRDMVVFATQNLINDPPFTKLDLLTCRNLLIYLEPEVLKLALPVFHYSLKPGGLLMLGRTESVGKFGDLFQPLGNINSFFRRSDNLVLANSLAFPTRDPISTTEPMQSNLQNIANDLLLQQFAPAAVLVTSNGDLVYVSGRTGKYLEPAAGKVNLNIYAMAREGLRQEIYRVLPQAVDTGETVLCRNVSIESSVGSLSVIDLTIKPIAEPAALKGMVMLVFADVEIPPSALPITSENVELEQLVARLNEEIQTLREEMQSAKEELQSANEDLQSTNEELASANEELMTSKDEMHSLNEELNATNATLKSKVEELSRSASTTK